MIIEEMLNDIDNIDDNLVVYVKQPILIISEVMLFKQDSDDNQANSSNWEYLLEIFIIKEIINLMKKNKINMNTKKIFEGIEYYAKYDSYPEWMLK